MGLNHKSIIERYWKRLQIFENETAHFSMVCGSKNKFKKRVIKHFEWTENKSIAY